MHFPKFMPTSRLQNQPPIMTSDHMSKSSHQQKSLNGQQIQNHNRRKNIYFSPTSSPSRHTDPFRDRRPHSPLVQPQQDHPYVKNPQTLKALKNKMLDDYKECVDFNRIRKSSENNIIFQNQQQERLKVDLVTFAEQTNTFAAKIQGKQRKTSCNLDVVGRFKKTADKCTSQEQCVKNKDKQTKMELKKQSWDQNNNFQFSASHSSDHQMEKQEQIQQQLEIPKIQNIRKRSDHDYVKYQAPSFLSPSKHHRNSFDTSELLRKKPLLGIQNFLIVRQLGQGTFGRVILAIQKESKIICAIKIMSKREIREGKMLEQLVRELKIQLTLNHPNIVKVYGYFDDLLYFYIIMECALDGRLSEQIQNSSTILSEKEAAGIMTQICSAVLVLHSESIIHRDLKPENVMFHEGIVKLCDFGWSVKRGSKLRSTFCGTPIYLSPQILIGDEYDESIDIWTLGIILYEILFKSNPFKITTHQNLINILNDSIYFDQKITISESAKNMISICLRKKAKERPSIRQLSNHPFLKNRPADEFKH